MRTPQLAARAVGGLVVTLLLAGAVAGTCRAASAAADAARAMPAGLARAAVAGFPLGLQLDGVAAISARSAWAVGVTGGDRTLIVHWDGRAWKRVRSPNPGPPGSFDYFGGVAAFSATSAWAVGEAVNAGTTLIAHWNGKSWEQVPSPSPTSGGDNGDALSAVAATSVSNAWAVGSAFSDTVLSRTLIEHWNGRTWKYIPSPNPEAGCGGCQFPGDCLYGVAATSGRDAWAVGVTGSGRTLIERWNGRTWTWVRGPGPASTRGVMYGVAAVSALSVWAVGSTWYGGKTLIEHWNGKTWKRVPSPSPSPAKYGNVLVGVAAANARNAWAVGQTGTSGNNSSKALILRWNGRTWKRVPSPSPGTGSGFNTVAAVSARSAWAAGFTSSTTLIARWNGKTWKRQAG